MNNYTNNIPYAMGFAHGVRNQQAQVLGFWDSKEDVALYVLGYEAGVRDRGEML
jgi:hypothetical protein